MACWFHRGSPLGDFDGGGGHGTNLETYLRGLEGWCRELSEPFRGVPRKQSLESRTKATPLRVPQDQVFFLPLVVHECGACDGPTIFHQFSFIATPICSSPSLSGAIGDFAFQREEATVIPDSAGDLQNDSALAFDLSERPLLLRFAVVASARLRLPRSRRRLRRRWFRVITATCAARDSHHHGCRQCHGRQRAPTLHLNHRFSLSENYAYPARWTRKSSDGSGRSDWSTSPTSRSTFTPSGQWNETCSAGFTSDEISHRGDTTATAVAFACIPPVAGMTESPTGSEARTSTENPWSPLTSTSPN